ncbi:MAG: hypothetical protein HRF49_04730 [bacterium]|jgi:hypothetical protein
MPEVIDKDALRNFIFEKWWGEKLCPICGKEEWHFGDAFGMFPYRPDGAFVPGGVLPVVPLVCGECGFTALFNPYITGFLKA